MSSPAATKAACVPCSAQATAEKLNVDLDRGLTDEEAEARRAQFGANELERKPPTPLWELIAEQFEDMLVRVLLLAAAVSFVLVSTIIPALLRASPALALPQSHGFRFTRHPYSPRNTPG